MKKENIRNSFENRAHVKSDELINCDNCSESVVFHMQDNNHSFSMGLTTILECVAFAVKNGDLPKLPLSWLSDVDFRYDTKFSCDSDLSYGDSNFPRKSD